MSTLRTLKKVPTDIYNWLMKYSGMTMIIDNVEERRRKRESLNHSDTHDPSARDR